MGFVSHKFPTTNKYNKYNARFDIDGQTSAIPGCDLLLEAPNTPTQIILNNYADIQTSGAVAAESHCILKDIETMLIITMILRLVKVSLGMT